MVEAPKPVNEEERLELLYKLQVLDTPIEERFERITRIVCNALDVPISAISLVDKDRQWFKSIQGIHASETSREVAFCAHAILDDGPLVVPDAKKDNRFIDNSLVTSNPNIRFYAGCPLIIADNIRVGTLCAIDDKPRELSAKQVMLLYDLTQIVKSELATLELSDAARELIEDLNQAERAALIDSLTRVWNRAGGEQLLEREWKIASRKSAPLAISMLDIDHFKQVNDTYGHMIGDEVLRYTANLLIQHCRPYDVICRWGGEEFLLMFPDCDMYALSIVLEKLVAIFHKQPVETSKGPVNLTVSIGGCATNPKAGGTLEEAIERADTALYQSKAEGRDQYTVLPQNLNGNVATIG